MLLIHDEHVLSHCSVSSACAGNMEIVSGYPRTLSLISMSAASAQIPLVKETGSSTRYIHYTDVYSLVCIILFIRVYQEFSYTCC